MSLLSPSQLLVFLAPGRAVALRRSGLFKPRVEAKAVFTAPEGEGGAGLAGTAQAYASALRELGARRVRVVLSNHFVQYLLQPWREDLKDADEEAAFARHAFVEVYGQAAIGWSVQVAQMPPEYERVTAAVPSELLQLLGAETERAGAQLVSVSPYFIAAFNAWRRQFDGDRPTWLVTHESGRLGLGFVEAGRWRWIRATRVGEDWSERLPDLIENEAVMAGCSDRPAQVLVFSPATPMLAIRAGTRLPFQGLRLEPGPGFSPQTDAEFGLAMIG